MVVAVHHIHDHDGDTRNVVCGGLAIVRQMMKFFINLCLNFEGFAKSSGWNIDISAQLIVIRIVIKCYNSSFVV